MEIQYIVYFLFELNDSFDEIIRLIKSQNYSIYDYMKTPFELFMLKLHAGVKSLWGFGCDLDGELM